MEELGSVVIDKRLWIGSFWNSLIYPEKCTDATYDPEWTVSYVYNTIMQDRFPDFVVCVGIEDRISSSDINNDKTLDNIVCQIRALIPEDQRRLIGFAHYNIYFCGFYENRAQGVDERLIQRLTSLQETLNKDDGIFVTIGIAFLPEYSLDGWRWAAQRAVVAERQKIRKGPGRVYLYSEDYSERPPIFTYQELIEKLWHLVLNGRLPEVDTYFNLLNRELFEANYIPILDLHLLIQIKINVMGWAAIQAGVESSQIFPRVQDYLSTVSTLYDYVKLRELLFKAVTDFTSCVYNHYVCTSSYIIKRAEDFIDNNLDEDLSLKRISDAVGVHPSYLSRSFNSEKGISLTKYINQKRIDHAKQLLLDRKLTITEIALSVGFNTIQHFGRVFKEVEGCSPSDYREMAIVKNNNE